jgi:hypothetical protein
MITGAGIKKSRDGLHTDWTEHWPAFCTAQTNASHTLTKGRVQTSWSKTSGASAFCLSEEIIRQVTSQGVKNDSNPRYLPNVRSEWLTVLLAFRVVSKLEIVYSHWGVSWSFSALQANSETITTFLYSVSKLSLKSSYHSTIYIMGS